MRLFKVYVTQDEYLSLGNVRQFASVLSADSSFCSKNPSSTESTSNNSHTSAALFNHVEKAVKADSRFVANHEEHRKTDHATDFDGGDASKLDVISGRESTDDVPLVSEEKEPEREQLVELEMFVHGTSDSVCVLLMESGALSDVHMLKAVVSL